MKDDRIYLLHILDAIRQIVEYTAAGKESFFADRKTQDAVVRNLEIIGEATKRVSLSLKTAHPDIAWKAIYVHGCASAIGLSWPMLSHHRPVG